MRERGKLASVRREPDGSSTSENPPSGLRRTLAMNNPFEAAMNNPFEAIVAFHRRYLSENNLTPSRIFLPLVVGVFIAIGRRQA